MYRSLFTLFLTILVPVFLRAEYFTIRSYDVDIRIDRAGYFDVTETIAVEFTEPRHGIYRTIPVRVRVGGENYRIDLSRIDVEGRKHKTSREGNLLRIRIGDPDRYVEGQQTYVIHYRVRDAWLFQEEHTEFYWNLVGTEWEVPIEAISYQIELPDAPSLLEGDYRVFTGSFGTEEQDATITFDGSRLRGRSSRAFAPGEGLTVAIRLPADYIERPSAFEVFMKKYGLLGLPLAWLAALGFLFWEHGRDESFVEMVEYYPPEGFNPAEAGGFIDDKSDNRDLTALIPYWAGDGLLEIREHEEKKLLIFSDTDYEFVKLKDLPAGRPDYESTIFNGLFSDGDSVRLSDLKNKFYTYMNSARRQLTRAVREMELHTPYSRQLHRWLPLAGFVAFVSAFFLLFQEQFLPGGAMVLAAMITFAMRRPMLRKNKEGMDIYKKLHGFRMFVNRADRDRIERLLAEDPAYFEKTLPYAIAFGVAKKWASKFDGLFTEPPRWYVHAYHQGPYRGTDFNSFVTNFDAGMREIQSVFTSSPSKSSGGGGGGSSGGGFGGGGGGSW